MTHNELLAAVRFAAWVLEASVAVIAIHYVYLVMHRGYRLGDRGRVMVGIGISIKAAGWALHQHYWWLWEMAIVRGSIGVRDALEHASLVTVLAYLMIFAGEALVVSPWLWLMFGRRWHVAAATGTMALLAIGVALIKV